MEQIDVKLYEYLLANLPNITEEWLATRTVERDSIYSLHVETEVEETLREQNKLTILTVTSSLLDDCEVFTKNKEKWATVVALSRVNSNTPIEDVLSALSNVRLTYWRFIKKFYLLNRKDVTIGHYVRWSETINSAFDQIYIDFARTYNKFMKTKFDVQQSLINELSSPVIKLTDQIGVVPLIGDLDEVRARILLESIPEKCVEAGITHLFIDLSGVTVIDTHVVQQVYQITQILALLGMKSTITGIRPEIAQTSTELGLDFSNIQTYSSLQQAFSKGSIIVAQ